jgi:pyruvate,water dikinase
MLDQKIEDIVDAIDYESIESLRRGGMEIRQSFLNGKFPKKKLLEEFYVLLSRQYGQE